MKYVWSFRIKYIMTCIVVVLFGAFKVLMYLWEIKTNNVKYKASMQDFPTDYDGLHIYTYDI